MYLTMEHLHPAFSDVFRPMVGNQDQGMKNKNGYEMVKKQALDLSIYHHPARKNATILMAPTGLRVTKLKYLQFSWSEPQMINIIK